MPLDVALTSPDNKFYLAYNATRPIVYNMFKSGQMNKYETHSSRPVTRIYMALHDAGERGLTGFQLLNKVKLPEHIAQQAMGILWDRDYIVDDREGHGRPGVAVAELAIERDTEVATGKIPGISHQDQQRTRRSYNIGALSATQRTLIPEKRYTKEQISSLMMSSDPEEQQLAMSLLKGSLSEADAVKVGYEHPSFAARRIRMLPGSKVTTGITVQHPYKTYWDSETDPNTGRAYGRVGYQVDIEDLLHEKDPHTGKPLISEEQYFAMVNRRKLDLENQQYDVRQKQRDFNMDIAQTSSPIDLPGSTV